MTPAEPRASTRNLRQGPAKTGLHRGPCRPRHSYGNAPVNAVMVLLTGIRRDSTGCRQSFGITGLCRDAVLALPGGCRLSPVLNQGIPCDNLRAVDGLQPGRHREIL
ncbi:hypothetical protein DPMN_146664 [Dreissena polymorpha]|uniref:Uncharacterized protein n=1 Tax=Dreissena polymorpha TaxID=45954 RepID=A0A9D4J281_DREPO|nr:hypothetical protein DPMN_146664 [Dreissena polymorpha]